MFDDLENLERLKTWPEKIYLDHLKIASIPDYIKTLAFYRPKWLGVAQHDSDIEYIRSDLVKVKTEQEIKDIIFTELNNSPFENPIHQVNAIFNELKLAGLHCK